MFSPLRAFWRGINQIIMMDEFGDGWVGGVDGTYNLWELWSVDATAGTTLETRGTLADNHESGTTMHCLADGKYIFNTTANAAFAEDIEWGICENFGFAGVEEGGREGERSIDRRGGGGRNTPFVLFYITGRKVKRNVRSERGSCCCCCCCPYCWCRSPLSPGSVGYSSNLECRYLRLSIYLCGGYQ